MEEWTTEDWRRKLDQQAEESHEYRHKFYDMVDLGNAGRILDVGCGTGGITRDIALSTDGEVFGIDIDLEKMEIAGKVLADVPNAMLIEADAKDLPFEDDYFDLVVFHLVLIHIDDQQAAVNEMARVVRPGGIVLATLEPDYLTKVDHPENMFYEHFLEGLRDLGADLTTGRRLKEMFTLAGLKAEVGVETETQYLLIRDDEKEMKKFEDSMWFREKILRNQGMPEERIHQYQEEKRSAIAEGRNFSMTIAMWAIGRKE